MGRFIIGAICGALITVALFFVMQQLIVPEEMPQVEVTPTPVITITREIRDPDPVPEPPWRPTEEDQPPPPPSQPIPETGGVPVEIPDPDFGPEMGPIDPNAFARILSPRVRLEPQYPTRELQQGREGYAVIDFCVATDGRPSNINVHEETSSGFGRAGMAAVQGWIYDPQTDGDGNPLEVCNQRARFDFNLSE